MKFKECWKHFPIAIFSIQQFDLQLNSTIGFFTAFDPRIRLACLLNRLSGFVWQLTSIPNPILQITSIVYARMYLHCRKTRTVICKTQRANNSVYNYSRFIGQLRNTLTHRDDICANFPKPNPSILVKDIAWTRIL